MGTTVAVALLIGALGSAAAAEEVNVAPTAVPDSVELVSGVPLQFDPRINDEDPEGAELVIISAEVTSGSAGVEVQGTGAEQTLRMTADAGFLGTVVVTYVIADPLGAQAQSTVTATVIAGEPNPDPEPDPDPDPDPDPEPANRRPEAVTDTLTVRASSGRHRVRVLANDRDPDGDAIRLVRVRRAERGKAWKAGTKVAYQAPKTWTGIVRVRYVIRDEHDKAAAGVLRIKVRRKNPTRLQLERALNRLGLPTGSVDGSYSPATKRALCAWRTAQGHTAHRGRPTKREARVVYYTSQLPKARRHMVSGVNVSITCQTVFWVTDNDTYRRIMPGSSGKAGYRTRLGTWRIFITRHTWRYSTIYPDARMYKPMQFSGGQALHGSASDAMVKTYPASHGCVRMLHRDIDALQAGGVGNGTLVKVFGHWRG